MAIFSFSSVLYLCWTSLTHFWRFVYRDSIPSIGRSPSHLDPTGHLPVAQNVPAVTLSPNPDRSFQVSVNEMIEMIEKDEKQPLVWLPGRFHSSLIYDQIIFGRYPTQSEVDSLQEQGINYFIDLTNIKDDPNLVPYSCPNLIKYPIPEGDLPGNDFIGFILDLSLILSSGNKIYIHCRHGRGRSGLLVGVLLKYYYKLEYKSILKLLKEAHRAGHGSNLKKDKKIPPHSIQRDFILNFKI